MKITLKEARELLRGRIATPIPIAIMELIREGERKAWNSKSWNFKK